MAQKAVDKTVELRASFRLVGSRYKCAINDMMGMKIVRLLVVERDPIRQEGLLTCLSREPKFSVIGLGNDLVEALKNASPSHNANVAMLNMDQMENMRSWSILRTMMPDTRAVGFTDGGSDFILEGVLVMGINVLLRPNVEARVICNSVRNATKLQRS
jgi:DNA-binding NarL/FixJ family response regulator